MHEEETDHLKDVINQLEVHIILLQDQQSQSIQQFFLAQKSKDQD